MFTPAFTPSQIQRRKDFDPSSQDSADTHDSAFALSDDPLKKPGGRHRGPDEYAIRLAILRQDSDHRPSGNGIAVREFGHELHRRDARRLDRYIVRTKRGGRTKRGIRTGRIAGIASFNDSLRDIVRRGLRSTDGAQ